MHREHEATHKVSFYGIHCYFNEDTGELWGVNRACDCLMFLAAWVHNGLAWLLPGFGGDGFPLYVIEEDQ